MKRHCYSASWAEGEVIENILANKQRFIGTTEAGTEHRIMHWNLTGLCGAIWAEELINVWGPAGVICTFVDILDSHTVALIVLNIEQKLISPTRHLWTNYWRNVTVKMNVTVIVSFITLTHLIYPAHIHSDYQTAPGTPPVIQLLWPFVAPAFVWWTTGGERNLPLQPCAPQLPANIIKKAAGVAPVLTAILQLPSGCHLLPPCKTLSTSDLFLFRLTSASPLPLSDRQTGLRDTQRWLERNRRIQTKMTNSKWSCCCIYWHMR